MPAKVVEIAKCAAPVSAETVALLEGLLEDARSGAVTGIAAVVLRTHANYELQLRGSAADSGRSMPVAGMLAKIQRMVLELEDWGLGEL